MNYIQSQDNNKDTVYECIDFNKPSPLKVFNIWIRESQIHSDIAKHWHRSLEIIIPRIGETTIWSKGQNYLIKAGEVFIINSKDIHAFIATTKRSTYFGYVIQINYNFLKSCCDNFDLITFKSHYKISDDFQIFNLLNSILEESYSRDIYSHLQLYSLSYQLVHSLLIEHAIFLPNSHITTSKKQRDLVVDLLHYLDTMVNDTFNASEIAKYFNMSYGYLAHLFKSYLNMTMSDYVNFQRIKRCEHALLTTELPIIDIALDNGFANTKSFYQVFKKYHNITPKQFRSQRNEK